jgi:hypothetical protein
MGSTHGIIHNLFVRSIGLGLDVHQAVLLSAGTLRAVLLDELLCLADVSRADGRYGMVDV